MAAPPPAFSLCSIGGWGDYLPAYACPVVLSFFNLLNRQYPMPLTLPRHSRFFGRLVHHLYYRHVDVRGAPVSRRPTLFLLSHRNGATDGQIYMAALGAAPSLISIQLLRHWFLRLFFTGIPVVRDKDRERYGIAADAVPSPISAAITQLKHGGSLCIYPEGTSAWQARPLPYHSGMAVIAARLKTAGVDFDVQPLAAHYSKPDGFRSRVSIIVGPAFRPQGESVRDLQAELSAALAAISVNAADNASFNRAVDAAWQAVQHGDDYGEAYLCAQAAADKVPPTVSASPQRRWAQTLFARRGSCRCTPSPPVAYRLLLHTTVRTAMASRLRPWLVLLPRTRSRAAGRGARINRYPTRRTGQQQTGLQERKNCQAG